MSARFPSLYGVSEIPSSVKAMLLDAYGVFWGGNEVGLYPEAKAAMEKLVRMGKIVGILSNATQLVDSEEKKLERHGLRKGEHYHFLITSGQVARDLVFNDRLPFQTPRHKYYLFCDPHPKFASPSTLFDGKFQATLDVKEADFIYISIPHIQGEDQTDPKVFLQRVEQLADTNLPMFCANPDCFCLEGKPPRAVVRQGSIGKLYENLGGKVHYIGKPYDTVYSVAMREFRVRGIVETSSIMMIGDTLETDILGGKQQGMRTVLITQTGIMHDRIKRVGIERAFQAITFDDCPDFIMERFRV